MKKRIDLLERQLIKNNIEIHNVPFTSKENLREIVLKLCVNSLQVDIDNRSIDTCYRKKSYNKNDCDVPIVVRFCSYDIKMKIMKKKYELKPKIKSDVIVPGSEKMIYINDYLTSNTKKIYYEAKKIKEIIKFKHLWIRNNNVMIRQSDGDDIIHLR